MEEVQKGPANAKPALTLLATLYGLTRVERRMAFYLAAGMPQFGPIWRICLKAARVMSLPREGTCCVMRASKH